VTVPAHATGGGIGAQLPGAAFLRRAQLVQRMTEGQAAEAARASQRRAADALWTMSHAAVEQGLKAFEDATSAVTRLRMAALHHQVLGNVEAAVRALDEAERVVQAMDRLATNDNDKALAETFAELIATQRARLAELAAAQQP
jgi:hypothetical protein